MLRQMSWLLGEERILESQIRSKICVLSKPLVQRKYFRDVIDKPRLGLEQDSLLPDAIEKGFLFPYPQDFNVPFICVAQCVSGICGCILSSIFSSTKLFPKID